MGPKTGRRTLRCLIDEEWRVHLGVMAATLTQVADVSVQRLIVPITSGAKCVAV
jgi:hypothetical protein